MKSIPLSEIYYAAKSKPTSYLQEALKRGNVKNNCLELSDEDFNFLKKISGTSAPLEKKAVAEQKIESETDSKISNNNAIGEQIEKVAESSVVDYVSANDKQARLGRPKIN
jgi:hypothetical protein